MKPIYLEEHLGCSLYATAENTIFRLLHLPQGAVATHLVNKRSVLSFLLKGKVIIRYGISQQIILEEGQLFLLPVNVQYDYEAVEDTEVLHCVITANMRMCTRHSMKQFNEYLPAKKQKVLYYLEVDERIRVFIHHLANCLHDGLSCLHYQQMKREELFLYLRAGYSREELALFFYPLLGKDIDFKDFVLANYKNVHDVKDFAEMANMSVSTFSRRFKDTFSDTTQHWLIQRKAEEVLNDIVKSDLPFMEISDKYNFSSPSYFVSFCKTQYGKTAAELRKEAIEGKP